MVVRLHEVVDREIFLPVVEDGIEVVVLYLADDLPSPRPGELSGISG
jgi:hypothetical protein